MRHNFQKRKLEYLLFIISLVFSSANTKEATNEFDGKPVVGYDCSSEHIKVRIHSIFSTFITISLIFSLFQTWSFDSNQIQKCEDIVPKTNDLHMVHGQVVIKKRSKKIDLYTCLIKKRRYKILLYF